MAAKKPQIETKTTANNISFWVDPADVSVLPGVEPLDEAQVATLVSSISQHGQKVPALVRLREDKTLEVVAGKHRHAAVSRIEGARLWVTLDTAVVDDKSALITTLIENVRRTLSDVEEAKLNAQLMHTHGFSAGDVAELYGKARDNTARVAQLERLLSLPDAIQDAVRTGKLKLTAAVGVWGDPDKTSDLVKKLAGGVRVTAKDTASQPKRNVSDLQKFRKAVVETDVKEEKPDPKVLRLLDVIIQYLKGSYGEAALLKAVQAIG